MQRLQELKKSEGNTNTDESFDPIRRMPSGKYLQKAKVKMKTTLLASGSEGLATGTADIEKEVHGGKPTKVVISNIKMQKDQSSSSLFKYSEITGSATVDQIQNDEEKADIKADITLGKAEGTAYYLMPSTMTQSVEEKRVPFHASKSQRNVRAKFSIYAPLVGEVTQDIEAEATSTPRFEPFKK